MVWLDIDDVGRKHTVARHDRCGAKPSTVQNDGQAVSTSERSVDNHQH